MVTDSISNCYDFLSAAVEEDADAVQDELSGLSQSELAEIQAAARLIFEQAAYELKVRKEEE